MPFHPASLQWSTTPEKHEWQSKKKKRISHVKSHSEVLQMSFRQVKVPIPARKSTRNPLRYRPSHSASDTLHQRRRERCSPAGLAVLMSCINSWLSLPLSVSQWEPVWKTLKHYADQIKVWHNLLWIFFWFLNMQDSCIWEVYPATGDDSKFELGSSVLTTMTYMVVPYSPTVAQLFWCIGQTFTQLSLNKILLCKQINYQWKRKTALPSLSRITKTFKYFSIMVLRKAPFMIFELQTSL